MQIKPYLLMLMGSIIMAGCSEEKKASVTRLDSTPKVMEPFRYHKLIEVAPGEYYDILSWGRGARDTGSFAILHSDSIKREYVTTTGDLDGKIVDVYNSDMDVDGNPEILIQTKGKDTTNYTKIYAFEYGSDNKANKRDFPRLTSSQRDGYRGGDNFYISEGKFIREFPIYDGNTALAKPTGAKRKLEYGLRGNEFTVNQLSKDSVKVSETPVKQEVVKKEPVRKKVVKKKKRRRR
ncbi:MAG: hypothetical protein EOP47_04390 [Sphingobacteriaceae bacterium]|nr:MAG: hypothetical protein EOP47_04390 [Sphingobacteriaceae bacterium]